MPNAGTVLVLTIVIMVSLLALRSVFRKKGGCGCNCSSSGACSKSTCEDCSCCSAMWVEEIDEKLAARGH